MLPFDCSGLTRSRLVHYREARWIRCGTKSDCNGLPTMRLCECPSRKTRHCSATFGSQPQRDPRKQFRRRGIGPRWKTAPGTAVSRHRERSRRWRVPRTKNWIRTVPEELPPGVPNPVPNPNIPGCELLGRFRSLRHTRMPAPRKARWGPLRVSRPHERSNHENLSTPVVSDPSVTDGNTRRSRRGHDRRNNRSTEVPARHWAKSSAIIQDRRYVPGRLLRGSETAASNRCCHSTAGTESPSLLPSHRIVPRAESYPAVHLVQGSPRMPG